MSRCAGTLAGCLWAVALLATSCTEVDNTVGGSLIPQQQQIQLAYTTTGGINAYLTLVDSLPAVYSPYGYIGNTSSPTFGQTLCSWVAQYAPYGFNTTAVTFGKAPVVDSLVLQLTIDESAAFGDATVPQTFHVYELTRRFYLDSIYTTPMDLVGAFSSEPVGTFTYSGGTQIRTRLNGPGAQALIDRLIDESGEVYYTGNDSVFIDRNKGFYIVPADVSPEDASAVAISASTEYTQMMIYTHHLIPSVSDPAKDSTAYVTCQYTFSPSSHSVLNFNQYDHDYSGSTLGNVTFNDTLPDSPTVSLGYVQGGGGVATYVRLTEAFAQALLDKLQDPYRVMLINGARLEISLNNATPESLDVGFNRMGSYLDYKFLTPTVDYQYMDEFDPYNPVVLPYGGYLNRTRQSYSMDITRMVQQVVSSSTPTSRAFVLAPSYGADLYGLGEAVLNMAPTPGNPTPLTVTVSYTLLR